jgi:hypothetical protein
LVSAIAVLTLFASYYDEAGLDAPVLADHRGVPSPPFFRFAEPDQNHFPVRH